MVKSQVGRTIIVHLLVLQLVSTYCCIFPPQTSILYLAFYSETVHQTVGSVCLQLTFVLPVQFRKIYLEQMRAQAWQHSYPLEMVWNPRLICHKG